MRTISLAPFSFFLIATLASLIAANGVTKYSTCALIENAEIIKLLKLTPITKEFKRDDLFQEYWFSYYSGKYRAQIVEYPYGGGSVLTLEIISGKNFLVDEVVIGVKDKKGIVAKYYWIKKSSACRTTIDVRFRDVTSIAAYLPEDRLPPKGQEEA